MGFSLKSSQEERERKQKAGYNCVSNLQIPKLKSFAPRKLNFKQEREGLLSLPTGKIVANDPCVFYETDEFIRTAKPQS